MFRKVILTSIALTACEGQSAQTHTESSQRVVNSSPASSIVAPTAYVDSLYRIHFAGGQGFSLETAKARADWFTPDLYQLILKDMRGPDIGYINFDPFTAAQDDVGKFSVVRSRSLGDTTLVDVTFAGTNSGETVVTVHLVRTGGNWSIANLEYGDHDLLAGLRNEHAAERRYWTIDART